MMGSEEILEALTFLQYDLDEELDQVHKESLWREKIFIYLDKVEKELKFCIPPEAFDNRRTEDWLNVVSPPNTEVHFRDRLLLVDFFTYCCINCMHILPHLHRLEQQIPQKDLLVIGVHSAKFDNEKHADNVERAIKRYGIAHPVLNDPQTELWKLCQIICWPTLMLVGPSGQIIYKFIGEKRMDRLEAYLKIFIDYYKMKGQVKNDTTLATKYTKEPNNPAFLCAPGKIAVSKNRIAISDTANHRIVILDKTTHSVIHIVGASRKAGLRDGPFAVSCFDSPQGVCWHGESILYVADTQNHAVRKVDLEKATVTTIIGTGVQGEDFIGGGIATQQKISSPWDLVLFKDKLLLIAMAGTHQIWAYAIQSDVNIFGDKVVVRADRCVCIAGSGQEENRNTSYPLKAGFAQPSGLALDSGKGLLYVADSESSSIRCVGMNTAAVKNVCGGALDPLNLFAFGDEDGKGLDAKLQHPLAVAVDPTGNSVFIADSYNHKLKVVDPKHRTCKTVQSSFSLQLNEPGGLAVDPVDKRLYIADTNNHTIKILTLDNLTPDPRVIGPLLKFHQETRVDTIDSTTHVEKSFAELSFADNAPVFVTSSFKLGLKLVLPKNVELNADAPQEWSLRGNGVENRSSGVKSVMELKLQLERTIVEVQCCLMLCNKQEKTCEMKKATKKLELIRDEARGKAAIKLCIQI